MDEARCGRRVVDMEGIGDIRLLEAPTAPFESHVPRENVEAGAR
jgi:hypothetical protein